MKRYTAVLYALLLGLTLTSCEIDRGDGGVIGTIEYYLNREETAPVTEPPTVRSEATSETKPADSKKTTLGSFTGTDVIKQRSDTKIEYVGSVKELEHYTRLYWYIAYGEDQVVTVPLEINDGKVEALDLSDVAFDKMTEGEASGQIPYWVLLIGEGSEPAERYGCVLSNVIEGSIVFNDETVGDPDGLSFIESCMAADDLANEPDFLDEMRIYSSDGGVYKAEPADGTEDYYYGASGAEDSFHIVMTDVGAVLSIGSSGENDGSNVVMAVMEDGAEVTFFDADLENGCADIHGEVDAAERVYSVFVVDSKGGNYRRLSNILEYRLVEIE